MIVLEDMLEAYYDCRRRKRNTASAIEYEMNYESRLVDLVQRINDRTYRPGPSVCFVVRRPRYREVFAADFEDRIPHHYIALRLNPLFENIFGDRIFNCRPGKGQLYGVNTLKNDLRIITNNYTTGAYILKLDLKAFFMSIDKAFLARIIDDFVVRYYKESDKEDIRFLCRTVIMHSPEKNCIRHSPDEYWRHLPKEKSLFTNGEGRGIAIGNLFSQIFANYLLYFLQSVFVAHGIVFRGRYVDDMYGLSADKQRLLNLIPDIRRRLAELGLRLNEKKTYLQYFAKGITFTGARIYPHHSTVIRRTIDSLRQSVFRLSCCHSPEEITKVLPTVNSYLGIVRHHNTYRLRRHLLQSIPPSVLQFLTIKGNYTSLALRKEYRPHYHLPPIIYHSSCMPTQCVGSRFTLAPITQQIKSTA